MTTEELEKEAEEKYSKVDREFIDCQDEGEVFNIGYILGAEPREKRIAELEKENARLATNEKSLLAERKIIAKENTEAKNLIEELASSLSVVGECGEEECELIDKAQKFINKPIF